ncbi:acyltransferase family protein [Pseudomonas sp. NFXW11]|uniref:acyltransferase family protein n=1 Tax=Pseudomonas sp. NFXW11 TaxID=2819531 RepID=UPI003CF8DDA1
MSKVLNANLDALKVLLAIMVVALHCKLLGGNYTWAGYLLCNGLFRVAVPTFFIVNGYYLYQTLNGGHSFAQWFKRGLLIYLFWMLVYSPQYVDPATVASLGGLLGIVKKLLIGYFHLWYLLGMLGGGVLLLVLRKRSSTVLIGLALAAFLTGLGLQYARVYVEFANGFVQHFNQNDYTARNFLFMGFPFMAIGFLCARHQLAQRFSRRSLWCWLVLGLAAIFGEAALNFALRADVEQNFDFLLSLLVIAPALFLLPLAYFRAGHSNFSAKLSSAVYYLHPWFIYGALGLGMAYGNLMALLVLLLAFGVAPLLVLASRRVAFIL